MTVIDRLIIRTYRPIRSDRAAVVAIAIMQIFRIAPPDQQQQAIENYLRDEFFDAVRQAHTDISEPN